MENKKLIINSEKIMEDLSNITPEQKQHFEETAEALKNSDIDSDLPLTEEERQYFSQRLREATERRNERKTKILQETTKQTHEESELFKQIMNGTVSKQEMEINTTSTPNIGEDR